MRKRYIVFLLAIACAITAAAGSKIQGSSTLKDVQPVGVTDKKHKNQQYDLFFVGSGHEYTCRTPENKKMKATDFVVGSSLNYQINGNKGKVKSSGKQVDCVIVRVADASATAPQAATPQQ